VRRLDASRAALPRLAPPPPRRRSRGGCRWRPCPVPAVRGPEFVAPRAQCRTAVDHGAGDLPRVTLGW